MEPRIVKPSGLRTLARVAALAGCVLATTVCGEQGRFGGVTGPTGDSESPVSAVLFLGGPADTIVDITDSLKFTARTTDNVRVATMQVRVHGLATFALDTTVMDSTTTTAVTSISGDFVIALPANAAGQRVAIVIASTDAAGNAGGDSVTVRVDDPTPPVLTLRSPASGTIVPAGGVLSVVARGSDPSGIRLMGARIFFDNALGQPVTIAGDSTAYTQRLTTRNDTFDIAVPAALTPGTYKVHAFATDSSINANSTTTAFITVVVADTTKPFGSFTPPFNGATRVAGDSLLVTFRAQDLTGVQSLTLRGISQRGNPALGTDTTVARYLAKSVTLSPTRTDTTINRYLNAVLSDSTPELVYIEAVVTDISGNTQLVRDSVTIVAGSFVRLTGPAAGARVPVGVPLNVDVSAYDPDGLAWVGFVATGVVATGDSVAIAPGTLNAARTLALVTTPTTANGAETIVPFATDNVGNRFTGAAVAITFADTVVPTVTIVEPSTANFPVTAGDSVLARVRVQDNRGVSRVTITGTARRGVDSLGTGRDVQRFSPSVTDLPSRPTDTTFSRYLLATNDSSSEIVSIIFTAVDSSGNSAVDSATVRIVRGPAVSVVRPTVGATTSPGKSVVVEVRATDTDGVRLLGYRVAGVVTAQDSVFRSPIAGALADTATFIDTLVIGAGTSLGSFTVTPFALDSLGDPSGTVPGVSVTVQSASGDVTNPTVRFTVGRRVETDDSISVTATDAGGITRVGWTADILGGATGVAGDSTNPLLSGTLSDVTQSFSLNLPGSPTLQFPAQVVITAFALDVANNRGASVAETLTVVAGKTYALPAGSQIGDAIYNANRGELYLTNTTYDRLEVFDLATSSFLAPIPVGSRPVGIALFPRDSLGAYQDTVIIANSGGTNLSIVDVAAGREIRRQRLPNYDVQTVKTSTNGGGGLDIITTKYEFSDRPFHLGATCVVSGSATCTRVRVLYSTTPTGAQSTPLENRGYVAWVEIDNAGTQGLPVHLVYEHASGGVDTLQIFAIRDTMPGQSIVDTILGAGVGRLVTIGTLPFRDSTFVRNSGDFLHGLVGEGGAVEFARALTFDVRPGLVAVAGTSCALLGTALPCIGQQDQGVSPIVQVSDFVTNRAARVTAVATNFNGRTNLVRADSIYAFDYVLRQTGLMQVGGANGAVGMDFHPANDFDATVRGTGGLGGVGSPDNRLVFAARPDSSIDVFDTYFYGRVTDQTPGASTIPVPIRNALVGPVRIASVGGTTSLFGVTRYGLVVVSLPSFTNSLFPIIAQPGSSRVQPGLTGERTRRTSLP